LYHKLINRNFKKQFNHGDNKLMSSSTCKNVKDANGHITVQTT